MKRYSEMKCKNLETGREIVAPFLVFHEMEHKGFPADPFDHNKPTTVSEKDARAMIEKWNAQGAGKYFYSL